jgi:hypothetical protein
MASITTPSNASTASRAVELELAAAHSREQRLLRERSSLTRTLQDLESENAQLVLLREALDAATEELAAARRLRGVHEDMLSSLSWRLTRPLRWGIARVRALRRAGR